MNAKAVCSGLAGWTVISLRPASQQAAVRAAAQARGAAFVSLPGVALEALPVSREVLQRSLACAQVVFTSPAAVEFAHAAQALPATLAAIAVGSGTAQALVERGIVALQPPPQRMRSEGVLDLAVLAAPRANGACVGLVTAPGGRDAIAPALRERGFEVRVAEVYRRVEPRWSAAQIAALEAAQAPRAVLLTSGEALSNALRRLPAAARATLLDAAAIASSERLAAAAREAGFATTLAAASPRVESLLDALGAHAKGAAIR
jgi:uroporphyrinogen-III synthase